MNNFGTINSPNSVNTNVMGSYNTVISNPGTSHRTEASNLTSEAEIQRKVQEKSKALEEEGESNPQRELCRRMLSTFYSKTTDPDMLAIKLQEEGVLTDNQVKKVKSKPTDFEKNDIIYDIVFQKSAMDKLIPALKKSGNDHIVKLIDELAS